MKYGLLKNAFGPEPPFSTLTDVEKKLRESETTIRRLIDTTEEMISTFTPKGEILFANKSWKKHMGYREEEIQKLTLNDILTEDSMPDVDSNFERLNKGETVNDISCMLIAKNGNKVHVEGTLVPLMDNGRLINAQCFFQDVTGRKKVEEEMQRKNLELEKINAELDRFVYSTSHDLRSPLTSMLGLIGFIETETQEADTRKHAEMIRSQIGRLDNFIRNILNYSRNNRVSMQATLINFREIVESCMANLQHINGADKIHVSLDIQGDHPFYSDEVRITAIFENLISNAIKYHHPDQDYPFIRIGISIQEDQAKITIQDNGIGIESKHQPHVFDMFYRVLSTLPGSGLGLYIVKESLERLSGTISLSSEPQRGSTFTIKLKNLN